MENLLILRFVHLIRNDKCVLDSNFIENHVSKPWSSDPKYVRDRVESSINFFKPLIK